MNMENREMEQIILENKIIKKEKRMGKLQNAIHKHQRRAHVCGEYGDIQKEQRHFDIIDSLIEKVNRLGKEIEELEKRTIKLAFKEPPEPIHWGFCRMDEGPPPEDDKPHLDWDDGWKEWLDDHQSDTAFDRYQSATADNEEIPY